MIAGELADLAGETDRAISEEDLSLADAAGVEEDLPRRREARRVLMAEPEIEPAERDPAGLTPPPDMDQPLAVRQQPLETGAGQRRRFPLEPRREGVRPRVDRDVGQATTYWAATPASLRRILASNSSATRASLSRSAAASIFANSIAPIAAKASCTFGPQRPISFTVGTMRVNRRLRNNCIVSELSRISMHSSTGSPNRSHTSFGLKRSRMCQQACTTKSSRSARSASVSCG